MGTPKLLLPWGNERIIDQVLRAWTESEVDQVVLVSRLDDPPLHDACLSWPIQIITPQPPPTDMKHSVILGLDAIEASHSPRPEDGCLIAPADVPTLTADLINQLIRCPSEPDKIIVPWFGSRPGHPVLFPWSLTERIRDLPADKGINSLVATIPSIRLPLPEHDRPRDVDTPAEYQRQRPGN